MPSGNGNVDLHEEIDGTYVVMCKNKKRLLYDGLSETFKVYGKIAAISEKGNRNVMIRFCEKESALNCYYDLHDDPDFSVDLPKRIMVEDDAYLGSAIDSEAIIRFGSGVKSNPIAGYRKINDESTTIDHFIRRKRNIVQSRAFKRFIISLTACNQYKTRREDVHNLISELKYQLQGVKLDFKTGFSDEIEDDSEEKEIPQLILAQDLYYFQKSKIVNAVDLLISNLPPWYHEVDVYKLILPQLQDDLLGIDWYRMYASGTDECSIPYCIVYIKTKRAACELRYCIDGLVLNSRRISVCLMDDVEKMLIDVRDELIR